MGLLLQVLKERRVLTNVRLTEHQKEVLVRVHTAPNESVAADEALRGGRPYVEATHTLTRLGFIDFNDEERTAVVTEIGTQVMKDAYLLDEMGQLTPEGQKYVESPEGLPSPGETPPTELGDELGGDLGSDQTSELGDMGDLGLESFSLIKSLSNKHSRV